MANMDLDPKRFGAALGLLFGGWLFVVALTNNVTLVSIYASLFSGYTVGGLGAIKGFVYGLILGGILGYIFAWLYNYLKKKI